MYAPSALALAKEFVHGRLGYQFSPIEERVLRAFFTNLDRRVFFMHTLPANVGATLLAMFSRMKNPRGIRGVFVDSFLPEFLASSLPLVESAYGGNAGTFLREKKLNSLASFVSYSPETRALYDRFVSSMTLDADYLRHFAESKKARRFLSTWLDKYGHNSIARMASLWVCFEQISLLAAKTIEWGRPGAGYIELSTRYVDMSAAGCYPIERELSAGWQVREDAVRSAFARAFERYERLAGRNFDGSFPTFLRERFGAFYADALKDLEAGVIGETCDVLGNLLPCSALTSVAACVSGEAFPVLLKHLLLDATPENLALCELIVEEAGHLGASQFARHYEPTVWEWTHWQYLGTRKFKHWASEHRGVVVKLLGPSGASWDSWRRVTAALESRESPMGLSALDKFMVGRGEFDKLPPEFEHSALSFTGLMSFRGWRDLHRQGFCTHNRTLVTPDLGYYRYDKPAPGDLQKILEEQGRDDASLYMSAVEASVPPFLTQYLLTLGERVGFTVSANLRELEFCTWQRSKFSVNHEVRQAFLGIEACIRHAFQGWPTLSRCDMTPAYVFARGERGIPLTEALVEASEA